MTWYGYEQFDLSKKRIKVIDSKSGAVIDDSDITNVMKKRNKVSDFRDEDNISELSVDPLKIRKNRKMEVDPNILEKFKIFVDRYICINDSDDESENVFDELPLNVVSQISYIICTTTLMTLNLPTVIFFTFALPRPRHRPEFF